MTGHHKHDQQQADQIPQTLIQEGRMHLDQLTALERQLHPAENRGLCAESLTVHEVAPAANDLADQ